MIQARNLKIKILKIKTANGDKATRGSLAARSREMSGKAEGRPTGRRPATSGENIRDIRGA